MLCDADHFLFQSQRGSCANSLVLDDKWEMSEFSVSQLLYMKRATEKYLSRMKHLAG